MADAAAGIAATLRETSARWTGRLSARLQPLWTRTRLPLAVLLAGVALSAVLSHAARVEIERSAQVRFDADATGVARDVEAQFDAYTEVLIGLRALFHTSDTVTRSQFHRYVTGLNLKTNFPGFQVLNFVPYVPASERRAFEEGVRRDVSLDRAGYPNFAITPPGERADYYPLTYMEPMAGNERVFGKDLGAVPAILTALQRARDTGAMAASGKMIRIMGKQSDIGLAMRLPVYRAGMPQSSTEERRAAYIGSVGAGFSVAGMMQNILKDNPAGRLRLRLFDGGPAGATTADAAAKPPPIAVGPDSLLFDTVAGRAGPGETATERTERTERPSVERVLAFDLGGRAWVMKVSADADRVSGQLDRLVPWLILFGGVAISALLAGIVYSLTTSRARAIRIASSMTADLRTSEHRLEEAQHLASLGSWILDAATGELHCSGEALRILGLDASAEGANLAALLLRVPAADRAAVEREIATAARSRERREFEHRVCLPDGTERWVHAIVQLTEEDGKSALRGTVRDDTPRKKGALRLQLEHHIARLLVSDDDMDAVVSRALEAICSALEWDCGACWIVEGDGLAHCGPARHITEVPALAEFVRVSRSLSYRPTEGSLGRAWSAADAVWIDTSSSQAGFTRDALAAQAGLAAGVVVPMAAGGSSAALEFFGRQRRAADVDMLESLRAVAMQIGQYQQRKQAEQTLRYVATHDSLTGLSNRAMLHKRLSQAIKRSDRHQKRLAVLFVDLDRFKHINDTLGHGVGDAMIRACATRLTGVLREGDGVTRFGGDEFVLILEDLSEPSDAVVVVNKVLACCAEPFAIDGHELHVTASVGISLYPEDGSDGETLLKNADTAMYRAKDAGRSTYQFYAAQMNTQGAERFMLESGLRRALERGELTLHYQPKMDLRTQCITGVEALMRWRHPVLGMVSPAQFIPIAEEAGLIEAMGKWALEVACADARQWQQRGLPPVQMSVNLSPRQLNSATLIADIAAVLATSGIDPALLELEITESAMMQDPTHAAALLHEVRDMGVRLAIDDFGTGYSSLSYLKRFPLSTVKIDRSFVNDVTHNDSAAALINGIIGLAHGMGMKVVAEGVETAEQLAYLCSHDCDQIQGYFLCKPMAAEPVFEFMTRHLNDLSAPMIAA
ncbi:MAG TPA: EAL domain-containing protein [Albitalea sp.]